MNFGDRLKILRLKKGITQERLGKELNVTGRTVGNYETGQRFPDEVTIKKIIEYFNTTADYLFGLSSGTRVMKENLAKELANAGVSEINFLNGISLKELNEDDLEEILKLAKKIKRKATTN